MFKNLPRQTFGRLQSKLFPAYFALSASCAAIQLGVLTFAAAAAPQKQLVLVGGWRRWHCLLLLLGAMCCMQR